MKYGWKTKTLGEVLHKTETVNPRLSPKVEFAYIDVSSVSNETFRIEQTQRLKGEDSPSRARRLVKVNDVLFATVRPTLQRIAVVPDELDGQVCSTGYFVLRPKPELDHRFVFYSLLTEDFLGRMEALQTGASYPAVNDGQVRAQALSYPDKPEQQRIVGILDEAFDGIATAKRNAEKNLQNARALFEIHLNAVFTQRGEGWVEKKLGELAEFKNGLNYTKNSGGQTVPVVGVGDFQTNVIVPIDNLQTATIDGQLEDVYAIRQNDILTVRSNGSKDLVGRCMIVPKVNRVTSYSGFVIRIRFDPAKIAPMFLLHMLKSSSTRDRLTREGGGANISNINQSKLSSLPVPVPPLGKQEAIANSLDEMSAETQRLESIYQRKLTALDELKKSLLHQAFRGQL